LLNGAAGDDHLRHLGAARCRADARQGHPGASLTPSRTSGCQIAGRLSRSLAPIDWYAEYSLYDVEAILEVSSAGLGLPCIPQHTDGASQVLDDDGLHGCGSGCGEI